MTAPATPLAVPARRSGGLAADLVPGRDDAVDLGISLLLTLLGLVGFHHVFGSLAYLVVGMTGAVMGGLAAHLAVRIRPHPALVPLLALMAFVLAGGVAVPDEAVVAILPGPGTPRALVTGLIDGWKAIVTVAPPVGLEAPIGVVPYACGFGAGFGAMYLARRWAWALPPVGPGAAVLVASLVLGTRDPVSILVQGSAFTAVAIGWGSVRANRPRRSAGGEIYWPRVVSGAAMLAAVVALALPASGALPLASTSDRYVLRDEIVPPFDPRNEPSPLGGFRSHRVESRKDEPLLRVEGLPAGQRVRIASMDTYDGVVWVVGGPQATGSGRFERVGEKILPTPPGEPATIEVEILGARRDVWMPTVGWTRAVEFEGAAADERQRTFRYNRATGTAAVPGALSDGDRYVLSAHVPDVADPPVDASADSSVRLPSLPPLPDEYEDLAADLMGVGSDYEQVRRMADTFAGSDEEYFYSDGEAAGHSKSPPGHSLHRLEPFVRQEREPVVGNAEQYAATMALLLRSRGLPARVVLGFDPSVASSEDGGADGRTVDRTFTAGDVHAWVEVAFEGTGWVAFDPTPPRDDTVPREPPPPQEQDIEPPQDVAERPHLQLPEEVAQVPRDPVEPEDDVAAAGFAFPAWLGPLVRYAAPPVLLVGGAWTAIVGGKALRRRRRRTRGSPVERLSGAWREVCDCARDRGASIPSRVTRQEAARAIEPAQWPNAGHLARAVDGLMFGANAPDLAGVEKVWAEVDQGWSELLGSLSRRDRMRTVMNLASLRRAG